MARLIQAPALLELATAETAVFLAGSIDQGEAVDWQTQLTQSWADLPITILNPRRSQWDDKRTATSADPQFRAQVAWELAALERANLIAMYLAPQSQAPISLLELGLFARSGKILVCCPPAFWRFGNVQFICEHFQIPLFQDLDHLESAVRQRVGA